MTTLMGIAIALTPILTVAALLGLATWRDGKRLARQARQIELTEAIHRELGAAVAPVVEPDPHGGWLVKLSVPLDQPALITALIRITDRVLGPRPDRSETPLRIVLTPAPSPAARHPRAAAPRVIAAGRSAVPALR